jgi:tetratricopeptide (TPR) repeat protein
VLHNLGVLAYERGEYEEALDVFRRSLDIYRELDSRANIAWLVCDMGDVAHTCGDFATARARYTEAEDLFTAVASQQGHAWVQWKRGRVVWAEGDAAAAEQLFTTSLAYHQEQGDRMNSAWLLSDLGQVAAVRPEPEAQTRCAESLALFEALDQRPGIALVRSHLGRLALAAGAPAPARQQVGAALALCAGLGGGAVTRGVLISAAQVAVPGVGSARLLGAIDALCAAQGVVLDPWSCATRASAVAAAQAAQGAPAYQAAYAGGQGLDWAAALAEARLLLPPLPPD